MRSAAAGRPVVQGRSIRLPLRDVFDVTRAQWPIRTHRGFERKGCQGQTNGHGRGLCQWACTTTPGQAAPQPAVPALRLFPARRPTTCWGGATVSLRDSPCTAVDVAALGHCRSPARPTRQRARAVGGRSNSATRPGRFCQRRFQPASPARPPWPAAEPLATQPAKPVSERQASNRRDSKPKESAFDCPSVGGSAGILQLQASSIVGHLQPAELSGLEDRWEHAEAEAVKEPGLRLQVPRRRRHLL